LPIPKGEWRGGSMPVWSIYVNEIGEGGSPQWEEGSDILTPPGGV